MSSVRRPRAVRGELRASRPKTESRRWADMFGALLAGGQRRPKSRSKTREDNAIKCDPAAASWDAWAPEHCLMTKGGASNYKKPRESLTPTPAQFQNRRAELLCLARTDPNHGHQLSGFAGRSSPGPSLPGRAAPGTWNPSRLASTIATHGAAQPEPHPPPSISPGRPPRASIQLIHRRRTPGCRLSWAVFAFLARAGAARPQNPRQFRRPIAAQPRRGPQFQARRVSRTLR